MSGHAKPYTNRKPVTNQTICGAPSVEADALAVGLCDGSIPYDGTDDDLEDAPLVRRMRVTTRRALVASVAERWKQTYYGSLRGWREVLGGSSYEIYEKLVALDPATATPEEVDAIIGNTSWTGYACSSCDEDADESVTVDGMSDDCATLCRSCLLAALALLPATGDAPR